MALIIQITKRDLSYLKARLLERDTMVALIDRNVGDAGPGVRDALITAIERRVNYIVETWITEVSQ